MEVSTMTLQDYENIKRAHPDIAMGESSWPPIVLARVCVTCEGNGTDATKQWPEGIECVECGGVGYRLTADGKTLLQLVKMFHFGVAK